MGFGRALALSGVLHALAALVIPAMTWTESTAPQVETISFVQVTHIEVEHPHPRPQPQAAAPQISRVPSVRFVTHRELAHAAPHRSASPLPAPPRSHSVAPTIATVAHAGETVGTGTAVPQPTATPERTVASVSHHADDGYLPFGAEQPDPVLDPGILKQLGSLGVHVTLVVTVNEDGRTENVVFQPPIDPSVEAHIQSLLADASWDPAVCGGGIACEGRATIKL